MKRKWLVFLLVVTIFSQTGFAMRAPNPPNVALGEKQEIFYRMTVEESMQIRDIGGMTYYPKEDAVYLRREVDLFPFRVQGDLPQLESDLIVVNRQGVDKIENPVFGNVVRVHDFEVDQGKGYQLVDGQGPYLRDAEGNGVIIEERALTYYDCEVFGDQFAWIGLPFVEMFAPRTQFQFAALPETFDEQIVSFDRVLPIGTVFPNAFDYSPDGTQVLAFGPAEFRPMALSVKRPAEHLYVEFLAIPREANVMDPQVEQSARLVPDQSSPEWFKFEVKPEGVEDETKQYMVRDMYTTEDYIVVLFHQLGGESMQKGVVELGKAFLQRYTYEGELVDQLETNYRTRRIAPGPNGSTLYVQKRFIEPEESIGPELRDFQPELWQLEIIQMNWDQEKESQSSNRMHPVIAERTFGGRTLARFTDKGFGLLKQMEEETGMLDYRAPLKSQAEDVRLQIPYADLLVKAESGARNLMVSYQGQEIAIPFELLLSANLNEMPCQDEATIEIHLQADEEDHISYIIELFVVEQVDGMTKVVHRRTIQ